MFIKEDKVKKNYLYKIDQEIINDSLVDMASDIYNCNMVSIEYLGFQNSFRVIMSMSNSNTDVEGWMTFNAVEIDKELNFYHSKKNFQPETKKLNNRNICFLKFEKNELLKIIIEKLADDGFNGGFSAKGDLFFSDKENKCVFLGIIGDIKNSNIIKNYNLKRINHLPMNSWGIRESKWSDTIDF